MATSSPRILTILPSPAGGVAPLDIHESLVPGANQITISLVDGGGYLASSSVYLNTNCTQTGVTGPANITGNPISQANPTPPQLTQNFNFNTNTNQQVQFTYDLAKAQAAGTLSITDGTIPGTEDLPVDPATFQSVYVPQTSFSTSNCLVHTGEALPTSGLAACKLFTLECTVGAGSSESGALCPVSSMPNELFQDVFDGPAFTLPDIQTPNNGPTFHEGVGFLMASEDWNGGPCSFDPASGLESLPCPQNLLTSFSGPGLYIASGYTSHPNSTFIPVTGVPEDLTTVTVAGEQNGGWVNKSTANVTFSSQPPNLAGVTESQLPGVSKFVAAPILSITYGISPASNVPVPGTPVSTDTTVNSNVVCPTATSSGSPATVFTPPVQSLTGLADGSYLIHYFAQDCAGTEELSFQQDGTGSWSTSYYTVPLNVDTIAPIVASGPTLSPSTGSYTLGQAVTATYSCTDERSGVVQCGASTFSSGTPVLNTGILNSPVNTSTPGPNTFTVTAVDAAGNTSSASVSYVVTAGYDSSVKVTLSQSTVTYPLGTNVVIQVAPTNGHTPTGTVKLYDGSTLLQTSGLQGNGAAYLYVQGLSVGAHSLTAAYSGDKYNAAGNSAPVILTVNPVPVQLSTACWNANFPYGANYYCGIYTSSAAGPPQGVVTYQYDGGPVVTLPLQSASRSFLSLTADRHTYGGDGIRCTDKLRGGEIQHGKLHGDQGAGDRAANPFHLVPDGRKSHPHRIDPVLECGPSKPAWDGDVLQWRQGVGHRAGQRRWNCCHHAGCIVSDQWQSYADRHLQRQQQLLFRQRFGHDYGGRQIAWTGRKALHGRGGPGPACHLRSPQPIRNPPRPVPG